MIKSTKPLLLPLRESGVPEPSTGRFGATFFDKKLTSPRSHPRKRRLLVGGFVSLEQAGYPSLPNSKRLWVSRARDGLSGHTKQIAQRLSDPRAGCGGRCSGPKWDARGRVTRPACCPPRLLCNGTTGQAVQLKEEAHRARK